VSEEQLNHIVSYIKSLNPTAASTTSSAPTAMPSNATPPAGAKPSPPAATTSNQITAKPQAQSNKGGNK
jgi:hypothetical protein